MTAYKKKKRLFCKTHGSAMAEFVFVMPVLGIIFLAMYQLYLLADTKHNVIQSARYAAFGKAYSHTYPDTTEGAMKKVIIKDILENNQPEYEGWVSLTGYEIDNTPSYKASPVNVLDPVTVFFLTGPPISYGHAFDGDLDNKYECRIEAELRLRYLDHINNLAKVLGRDEMAIPPIKLVDSLVIIGNDWSSSTKKQFAERVGVPSSKSHYIPPDKGLWLYPAGSVFGTIFTTLNSVFGTIESAIGWMISGFPDCIDPRGYYFNDDNSHSPDYVH